VQQEVKAPEISYFEIAGAAGVTGVLPGICEAVLLSTGAVLEVGTRTELPSSTLLEEEGRKLPK
jgi:hypothetical protein